ncbi:DUF2790 domain-containing protein [Pseudomonas sp. xss_2]|uniref:DUF2790 domain-containing protein n=1 Tax=Pseudomonas sp. xss_2 TaxID=3367215 RepID=UPI00370A7217
MNFKTLINASLVALLGFAAISAQANTQQMDDSSVMQYRYGDRLDVKKVLSVMDDQSNACGVVNTRMVYLDSHGQQQTLQYRTYASGGCHES